MRITNLDLLPGEYRVRVEALQENQAANTLPISFAVHPD
jgi:hypothetical protein